MQRGSEPRLARSPRIPCGGPGIQRRGSHNIIYNRSKSIIDNSLDLLIYYLFLRFTRCLRLSLGLLAGFSEQGCGGPLAAGLQEGLDPQVIHVVRGHDHIDHRLDASVRGSTRIVTVPLSQNKRKNVAVVAIHQRLVGLEVSRIKVNSSQNSDFKVRIVRLKSELWNSEFNVRTTFFLCVALILFRRHAPVTV